MTFLSVRALPLGLGMLCILSLLSLFACSGGDDAKDSKAQQFKKMVMADMDRAEKLLPSPYDEANRPGLEQGLDKLFKDAAAEGKPITYAVALITDQGRVVSMRAPMPDKPGGMMKERGGLDYSRYDKVRQITEQRKAGAFVFYGPDVGKIYTVCRPAKGSGPRVGGLCVAFTAEQVEKKFGLTQEQFEALDFNS